jgi:hypothetical protein
MVPYLLDSDIFIQAKNLHYGIDFCPAFWEWLIIENQNRNVFSIEKVLDELESGGDELADWAKDRGDGFFLNPDQNMIASLGVVSEWVEDQDYSASAKGTFFQVADYYLISYAHSHDLTAVTHEVPSDSYNKIKIPNVCIGLGVKCMTPFQMLRKERARFILGP